MGLSPELMAMIKQGKQKYARNNTRSVKLKEGKTRIRLLTKDFNAPFWADLGVHWIKTEKNGKPVAVVGCHEHTLEQPCAICNAIDKAIRMSTDDDTIELLKEMKVRKSVLVNALIRDGQGKSDDPVVLELTPTTFTAILSMMEEYSDVNCLDPNDGIDFIVERKGQKLDTEYTVMPSMKSQPVPKGVLDKIVDLKEFIQTEYFRGDEKKALNALSSLTGIGFAGAAIAAPGKPALLTASKVNTEIEELDAVSEEDLSELETVAAEPEPAPVKAATKPAAAKTTKAPEPAKTEAFGADLEESELDDLLSELDGI